jgi:hypothetical protein
MRSVPPPTEAEMNHGYARNLPGKECVSLLICLAFPLSN